MIVHRIILRNTHGVPNRQVLVIEYKTWDVLVVYAIDSGVKTILKFISNPIHIQDIRAVEISV